MRRIWILALISATLASCGTKNTSELDDSKSSVNAYDRMIDETLRKDTVQENTANVLSTPVKLTEDDFAAKVFNYRTNGKWNYLGDKPCIVDFYADWCGPCRLIAPYMEEFAIKYSGKLYIYKVNTDYAQELSAFFSIKSIPAVMYCPMKGEYRIIVGANPKDTYKSLIESFLKVK